MNNKPIRCDIFCRVVDNYGDAAVCWRLASQLAIERGWTMRLWIDDLAPLARLAPDYRDAPVAVGDWPAGAVAEPAQVVIEAFACEPPEAYLAAMANEARRPVWINLEYLSAEEWIDGCHALPSPHPRLPLEKHFFFPGFSAASGGLPRETDYATRRAAFDPNAFRAEFGLPPAAPDTLAISLFSYPNPALPGLIDAWARSATQIDLFRPGHDGPTERRGKLTIHPLPFLPQRRYDELLWASDLNFVRGEDSFVRAQWAGKPFVWHIYPQADDAHRAKLEAFLARYAKVSPGGTAAVAVMADFWRDWNGVGTPDWAALAAQLPRLREITHLWAARLAELPDLANNLANFCAEKLK